MAASDKTGKALAGLRVLVTRPAHQAENLCALLEQAGAVPVRFPTIEIAPPLNPQALEDIINRLDRFDYAVFVSTNAVERAMKLIQARRGALPPKLVAVCVGSASAMMLTRFGAQNILHPSERTDSEGLLALPALQKVGGRRIVIFRGDGGRELIADTLVARGATVEHAECYRRARPASDPTSIATMLRRAQLDMAVATSTEALRNLYDMLDDDARAALRQTPLVVISERLREYGRTLGWRGAIQVGDTASDEAIVRAIQTWRESQKNL